MFQVRSQSRNAATSSLAHSQVGQRSKAGEQGVDALVLPLWPRTQRLMRQQSRPVPLDPDPVVALLLDQPPAEGVRARCRTRGCRGRPRRSPRTAVGRPAARAPLRSRSVFSGRARAWICCSTEVLVTAPGFIADLRWGSSPGVSCSGPYRRLPGTARPVAGVSWRSRSVARIRPATGCQSHDGCMVGHALDLGIAPYLQASADEVSAYRAESHLRAQCPP